MLQLQRSRACEIDATNRFNASQIELQRMTSSKSEDEKVNDERMAV